MFLLFGGEGGWVVYVFAVWRRGGGGVGECL